MTNRLALCVLFAATLATSASAQCATWLPGFDRVPATTTGFAQQLEVFDDGTGAKLYLGGNNMTPSGLLRFDGTSWQTVPGAVNGTYFALATLNVFGSTALYASRTTPGTGGGPAITAVLRFDGAAWTVLGSSGNPTTVRDFAVFDAGSGPRLYVAGLQLSFGGLSSNTGLACFDGVNWTAVPGAPTGLLALTVHDFGSGPRLIAGGQFTSVANGTVAAANIAAWDGTTWSALGTGADSGVFALETMDFGSGPRLTVGGAFNNAGGVFTPYAAAYDGNAWSALPGMPIEARTPDFISVGGVPYARAQDGTTHRWNGAAWTAISPPCPGIAMRWMLEAFDFGSGPQLVATAATSGFTGIPTGPVARFDGSTWRAVPALGDGLDGAVNAVLEALVGATTSVYAAGSFHAAGEMEAVRVAQYVNGSWVRLGNAVSDATSTSAMCLASFDEGSGPCLFIGGTFTSMGGVPAAGIVRWNGSTFSALGPGLGGEVRALAVFDDGSGPHLYAGGKFTVPLAVPACRNVAKWDGTAWVGLGSGVSLLQNPTPGDPGVVTAMRAWDDGSGTKLFVTGTFEYAGSVFSCGLARWDGTNWAAAALPVGEYGNALCGWNGALCIGNDSGLWTWNGSSTAQTASLLGGVGVGTAIDALAEVTDGATSRLYATGRFTFVNNVAANNVAVLDTTGWSALATGTTSEASCVGVATALDGTREVLFGGGFAAAGGIPSTRFAVWRPCADADSVCIGDGSAGVCPCGNTSTSGSGAGCRNSSGVGAKVRAYGNGLLAADTVHLDVSGIPPGGPALFFQATQVIGGGQGIPFGDGLLCASGTLTRLGVDFAPNGTIVFPPSSTTLSALGGVVAPATLLYQAWYRDAFPLCSTSTFNLTNGVKITWN